LDGQIWVLKSDSLTSPVIVTVTVHGTPLCLTCRLACRLNEPLDSVRFH